MLLEEKKPRVSQLLLSVQALNVGRLVLTDDCLILESDCEREPLEDKPRFRGIYFGYWTQITKKKENKNHEPIPS